MDDYRITAEKQGQRTLQEQPHPHPQPPKEQPKQKAIKKTLKIVIRMPKCNSLQLMASGRGVGEEGLSFL